MILSQLSEVIWRFYQQGKPSATKQTFLKQDISQMAKMAAANSFREQYYLSKRIDGDADYSFISPLLNIKEFDLGEPNAIGMRRVDMKDFDLYRMPKNAHFTNIYPVGDGCGGNQVVGDITQVAPGEENFYAGNPDFNDYLFFVVKGRGVNTYNIPGCITKVEVETTYDTEDADISLDIAFATSLAVLKQVLGINEANGEMQLKLKQELEKSDGIK